MTLSPGPSFAGDPHFSGPTVDVGHGFPTGEDGVWVDQDGCDYLVETGYFGDSPIGGDSPSHKNGRVLKFGSTFNIENIDGQFRFEALLVNRKDI